MAEPSIDSFLLDLGDDLSVLESAFRDDNFKSMLSDTLKEICSKENLNHYENELKKYENQRGADVSLIQSSPGIALLCNAKSEKLFVNIGYSDKIDKPLLSNLSWKIPHATTRPKKLLVNDIFKQLGKELTVKVNIQSEKCKECRIFDVIVNGVCVEHIKAVPNFKRVLVSTLLESVEKNYDLKFEKVDELGNMYVGFQTPCIVKTIHDPNLSNDEDLSSLLNKMKFPSNADEADPRVPAYKILHIDHITLQDFTTANQDYNKPAALAIEVSLPGIQKASDIIAEVDGKSFKLQTKDPKYSLEAILPYEVEDDPATARFDLSTNVLRLEFLSVVKKGVSRMTSVSTDSGIECDTGYRTCSDFDNSSVSSQEDCAEVAHAKDRTSSDVTTAPIGLENIQVPQFTVSQTNLNFSLIALSNNVLAKSVAFQSLDERTIMISYTSVGGGLTPLNYGCYIVVEPNSLRKNGLHHKVRTNDVIFKMRKMFPGFWKTIMIGSSPEFTNCFEITDNVIIPIPADSQTIDGDEKISLDSVQPERQTNNEDGRSSASAIDVTSTRNSECFVTSSWPRGILKSRSRSLSESNLGSFGSFATSFELDDDVLIEGDEPFVSSFEKKSVRFSGVVSEQLFKANSSILGQRLKNQKKATRRRRNIERRLSDGDNSSVMSFEESLSEAHGSSHFSEFSVSSTGTTTSTDGETSESDNKPTQNVALNGKARKKGGKGKNAGRTGKGQKNKKNKKDAARMNLSNEMIFQFDSI